MTRLKSVSRIGVSDVLLVDVARATRTSLWLRDNLGWPRGRRCRLVVDAQRGKRPVVLAGLDSDEAARFARRMADETGATLGLRPTV